MLSDLKQLILCYNLYIMKISKNQRSNLLFIIIILVIFFTPIGGIIKEQITRLLASSPDTEMDEQIYVRNIDWRLKGINTHDINYSDLEGKVIFINFWATWCPPCRAEMPSIQEFYEKYKEKVVFIMQSDEEADVINKFLQKNKYTFPVYNSLANYPNVLQVSSIPATYVIDTNGKVVVHEVGAVDWNSDKFTSYIDKLLKE